jgi:hypothetical protein
VCVCVCVCVCAWRGEFNRVVLVVQLDLTVYFFITFYLCKIITRFLSLYLQSRATPGISASLIYIVETVCERL